MFCQVCGAYNEDDAEVCQNCSSRLLILSGEDNADDILGSYPLMDEFLLERITLLEERLTHVEEALVTILNSIKNQDKTLLIGQAGLQTLREVLEDRGLVEERSFLQRWEERLNHRILSLERADKITQRAEEIKSRFKGKKKREFVSLIERAIRVFGEMEEEEGEKLLEQALRFDPKNIELLALLGELATLDGKNAKGTTYLQKVLDVEPDHFRANYFMALVHLSRNDTNEAKKNLDRCMTINPTSFLVSFTLGMLYYEEKNLSLAEKAFAGALLSHRHPQALFMLATIHYEQGHGGKAITLLKELVEKSDSAQAHFLLGLSYLQRNWTNKAQGEFDRALTLNPGRIDYQQALAISKVWRTIPGLPETSPVGKLCVKAEEALEEEKIEEALELYARAIKIKPVNPAVAVGYLSAALKAKRYRLVLSKAYSYLRSGLPEALAAPLYAILLSALRGLERYKEGVRVAKEMAHVSTSDYALTIAHAEWAYHLAQMEKNLDEAYAQVKTALDMAPDELIPPCYDILGWVEFKMGHGDEAYRHLTTSVKDQPNATNLLHLGMVCLHLGKRDDAMRSFQEARETRVNDQDLHTRLWRHLHYGLRRKIR